MEEGWGERSSVRMACGGNTRAGSGLESAGGEDVQRVMGNSGFTRVSRARIKGRKPGAALHRAWGSRLDRAADNGDPSETFH